MVTLGNDILNQIRRRLVDALRPKRIYLFGSRARGSPHPDSDLDICLVVGELERVVRLEIARRARRILLDLPWPVDVIVRREREFDERAGFDTTLEATVKNKGLLIHG
jgi:predicted nucleotidyltransferase